MTKPPPPTTTTPTTPAMTTTTPPTTQMPYQHLQQYICRRFNLSPFWLSYIIFDAVFVCRRRIPTTVRKVRGWYEKSMVRIVHGTKTPQMVRNVYGTKSLVPGGRSGTPPGAINFLSYHILSYNFKLPQNFHAITMISMLSLLRQWSIAIPSS